MLEFLLKFNSALHFWCINYTKYQNVTNGCKQRKIGHKVETQNSYSKSASGRAIVLCKLF
jgi:hypothetical protein